MADMGHSGGHGFGTAPVFLAAICTINRWIASGRLPISARNVRPLAADDDVALGAQVAEHSGSADLVVVGYNLDLLEHKGADMFVAYDVPADVLFVNAQEEIIIS